MRRWPSILLNPIIMAQMQQTRGPSKNRPCNQSPISDLALKLIGRENSAESTDKKHCPNHQIPPFCKVYVAVVAPATHPGLATADENEHHCQSDAKTESGAPRREFYPAQACCCVEAHDSVT